MHAESWNLYIEQYPLVMAAYRRMAKSDWFIRGGWVGFVGYYTHGIYLQLYKAHWYNQGLDGIHFEVALDAGCVARKTASIQLHITHKSVLPDRDRFNELTIPRMKQQMADWDARYQLSETKLSERINLDVPYTKSTFARRVADEFERLSELGVIVDRALAELWPQPGA